jgi:hypothetical protein
VSRLIPRCEYNNIGILNDRFLIGRSVGSHQLQLWFLSFPSPAPQFLRISPYACKRIYYWISSFLSATIVSIEIVIGVSVH